MGFHLSSSSKVLSTVVSQFSVNTLSPGTSVERTFLRYWRAARFSRRLGQPRYSEALPKRRRTDSPSAGMVMFSRKAGLSRAEFILLNPQRFPGFESAPFRQPDFAFRNFPWHQRIRNRIKRVRCADEADQVFEAIFATETMRSFLIESPRPD